MKKIIALTVVLTTAGCSLAPKFKLPFISGTEKFKEAPAEKPEGQWKEGKPMADAPRGDWWKIFGDDTLNDLEETAVKGNNDIAAAEARFRQAREIAHIARAKLYPTEDIKGGYTRSRINPAAQGLPPGTPAISDYYTLDLGLAYEFDFFGKNKNAAKAAGEDALSAEGMKNSLLLAMQADVAETYFNIRSLDEEIKLLQNTVDIRQDGLDILNKRLNAGSITALDTAQATVDLEQTRAQLQTVQQTRREYEHALAVLLGKAPSEFTLDAAPLAAAIPSIPAGLPSALLERRPDVAAAQHDLRAANARIGVARAAFFPDISLTAAFGAQSPRIGDLFNWSSRAWNVGPAVSIPFFNGGALIADKKRAEAVYDENVARYRGQVLNAFKDVEDSLSRLTTLSDQAASQERADAAASEAERLAHIRYENGDVGYLEDITAKSSALAVHRYGIQLKGARLVETVRLIRALGGGWGDDAGK